MNSSFELLSSMSPKVNKHTRPVRKAPSKLALKSNVRKSLNVLVFNNSCKNESIISIESGSTISETTEASSENSNILNETPIVISDSDNSFVNIKSGPSKAPLEMPTKTEKSKNEQLSNEKLDQIQEWIHNVNKNTPQPSSENLELFGKSASLDLVKDNLNNLKQESSFKAEENFDEVEIIEDSQIKDVFSDDEELSNKEEPADAIKDDANSEFEVLLDSLYGNSWRANKHEVLPSSEPQVKKTLKHKTPTTERRVKLNFDTLENKNQNKLLDTLQKARFRRALESPWLDKLKNICDPDTDSDEDNLLDPEKRNGENKILTLPQSNSNGDRKRDVSVFSELSTVLAAGDKIAGVNGVASSTLLSSGRRIDELFKKTEDGTKENREMKNHGAGDLYRDTKNMSSELRDKVPKSVPENKKKTERRRKKLVQTENKKVNRSEESDSSDSRRGLLPLRLNFDDDKENQVLNKCKPETRTFSFLASLSGNVPADKCDYTALVFRKNFQQQKERLTSKLFKLYNEKVFDNVLKDVEIEWNTRMRCTAGICKCKKITRRTGNIERKAHIVLASKVLDAADRVRDTLIHEMCHAATWIVNEVSDGHGAFWKSWACRAMKVFPELPPISRCHNYVLNTKYTYRCTKCGYSVGRHSKSLDVERKRCGYCLGKFEVLINKVSKKGETKSVPSTPKKPSAFALFVKDNYASHKSPGMAHADIMKVLGQKFSNLKVGSK